MITGWLRLSYAFTFLYKKTTLFFFRTIDNYKWSKKENFVIGRNGKERNDWTFTIGHEGNYANYEEKLLKNEIFDIGFVYPIVFKESFYKPIKKMINEIPDNLIGKQIPLKDYLNESVRTHDYLYRIWTYLELYRGLEYGYDTEIGRWIKVNERLEL